MLYINIEHAYKRTIDAASRAEALTNLKSATHRYHKLVIAAKQKYYSSLIHSSSSNLDTSGEQSTLFSIANLPLHSLAPYSIPIYSDTFCSFFSYKISSLCFTLD